MIILFYNKVLLRILVALVGLGCGITAAYYTNLSAIKLPEQGMQDALAIISFLVAGWLVMVIAEVMDNHYVRVFACLCVGLGGLISYKWVFLTDGPKLYELEGGATGMRLVGVGFWSAMLLTLVMLVILVVRLVLDKLNYGRRPDSVAHSSVNLGAKPEGMGEPKQPGDLPPIPVDTSPLAVTSGSAPQSASAASPVLPERKPGPVSRLNGIGGLYMGKQYELTSGTHTIGRMDAAFELPDDKQVSRKHAEITVTDAGIATLTDSGSTNGVFVNNERVSSIELAEGDVIRIGTTLFKVEA